MCFVHLFWFASDVIHEEKHVALSIRVVIDSISFPLPRYSEDVITNFALGREKSFFGRAAKSE